MGQGDLMLLRMLVTTQDPFTDLIVVGGLTSWLPIWVYIDATDLISFLHHL